MVFNWSILHLIESTCEKFNKLLNFKSKFLVLFKEKNFAGMVFASYQRKQFGQNMVIIRNYVDLHKIYIQRYWKHVKQIPKEDKIQIRQFPHQQHVISKNQWMINRSRKKIMIRILWIRHHHCDVLSQCLINSLSQSS